LVTLFGGFNAALPPGTDVGALLAQVQRMVASQPEQLQQQQQQPAPPRRPLVPLALDLSICYRIMTAELVILAVEPPADGHQDGEIITFSFPFGKEAAAENPNGPVT
jgi:hypothetical protein